MGETDDQRNVTRGPVKEIDVSSPCRMLRLLRFVDYALVILCGYAVVGFVLELITNPPVGNYPSLILTLIFVAVFSLCVYTGLSHVGVIDASLWQTDLIAFPSILVLCVSIMGGAFMEIPEEKGFALAVLIVSLLMFTFVWIATAALFGFVAVLLLRRTRIIALGMPLVDLLSHLRSRRGTRILSAAGVKRVNAPYGLLLSVVGAALLLVPLPKELRGLNWWLGMVGFYLLMKARRYFQVTADSLLSVDKRRPILFLRSFADDKEDGKRFRRYDNAILDFSLEIRLSNHFMLFGPFIAIGSPKESVPQPGAARILLSEEAWQPRVISWMNEASLIIMYSGKSYWVNWELAKIIETERVTSLILMIPEIRKWSRRRSEEIATRIDRLKEVFKDTRWEASLAAFQDFQDARAMLFDGDGSIVVIRSRPRNRESYHLAALVAHYIILNRAAKSVGGMT